jgi:DNA-binding response OmpR family regulator
MESKTEKLLVVESDDVLRERVAAVLADAGYQVSTDYEEGIKSVLAFGPDVVILGADPPQLDCCDLLSEIKGSEHTQNIRVVMLSPGGSGERTRGMDLGADDVLSLPFDPHELLSRVRSQLRTRHIADEFRERLRLAEENRNTTQQVVAAVNEERRTLRVGGLATVAVLVVAAVVFFFTYRRTQEQNPGLRCNYQIAGDRHSDAAAVDGPLASSPRRRRTQSFQDW